MNSAVVQAVAEGVSLAMDRTSLAQYGRRIKLRTLKQNLYWPE